MTDLERLLPHRAATTPAEVVAAATARVPGGPLRFADTRVRAFLADVSRALLRPRVSRRHPELAALGFFLRPTEIDALVLRPPTRDGLLRLPRGLVFHVPPANVDTIFVYSWALSALAGNPNIVRISPRADTAALAVLDVLRECLADAHPAIAATQHLVGYGRDRAATEAFSAACRLRVIWGGDAAIRAIREAPLTPTARDVTFGDRSSFCVISQTGWEASPPELRDVTAAGFHNDSYWFDQAACASPRAVIWVGDDPEAAHADFTARVTAVQAEHVDRIDAAMAVQKRVGAYALAVDGAADRLTFTDNDRVVSARLAPRAPLPRRWLGAGVFGYTRVDDLADLHALIEPRDQTLTHFGFTDEAIDDFARGLTGHGVDRVVPIGQALDFASIWDGYDLLTEFTRLSTVRHR